MKLLNNFKQMEQTEIVLAVLFIFYIVLPIETPDMISKLIDGPIGMIGLFGLAVYLFFNVNPIIAVLFVFVAYELLCRASKSTGKEVIMKHTPSQLKKDEKMKKMNPVKKETLEEEIVDIMAPVGKSEMLSYVTSSFSPVAEEVNGASVY